MVKKNSNQITGSNGWSVWEECKKKVGRWRKSPRGRTFTTVQYDAIKEGKDGRKDRLTKHGKQSAFFKKILKGEKLRGQSLD